MLEADSESSILARSVLEHLLAHPSLLQNLQFHQVQRFLELTCRIWAEVVSPSHPRTLTLPTPVASFLSAVLNLETELIDLTWRAFADPMPNHAQ
jgi:hypothetical protein